MKPQSYINMSHCNDLISNSFSTKMLEVLKPRVRNKRLYGTGISGLTLIIPKWNLCACEFPMSVREWCTDLYVRKIQISHWPNVQPPSHNQSLRQSQWQCGRVEEHQIVCETISVCNNPITCVARILAGAFRACNSDGHIELGLFGQWTPLRVRLLTEPAFCALSNTLCGMSHGDQHKTARSRAVKALITNASL